MYGDDDIIEQGSAWLVGPGILTMAAFPFALPLIALTIAPLIVIALVAAVAGVVVWLPCHILRLTRVSR